MYPSIRLCLGAALLCLVGLAWGSSVPLSMDSSISNLLGRPKVTRSTVYLTDPHAKTCVHGFQVSLNGSDVQHGMAAAVYNDTLTATGWGVLYVETRPIVGEGISASTFEDDWCRYYAAGVAEAAITANRIMQLLTASLYSQFGNTSFMDPTARPAALVQFLQQHDDWVQSNVRRPPGIDAPDSTDPHRKLTRARIPVRQPGRHRDAGSKLSADVKTNVWNHMSMIAAQTEGLFDGYNLVAPYMDLPKLDRFLFHMLTSINDVDDIDSHLFPSKRVDVSAMTPASLQRFMLENDHCSAIVSLTDDYSEVFFSHSTWYDFTSMNRLFKHYALSSLSGWEGEDVRVLRLNISFSSYPGYLSSSDDYYLLFHSGLSVMETSLGIFNSSLYDAINPETLLSWHRMRLGNALARTGREWSEYFSAYPSGTYMNQYMIFDFNLFTPSMPLKDNTLWVVEEIPTLIVSADQTQFLARGYWPSYNRPFYPEIYNLSNYPAVVEKQGVFFSYELSSRAKIFRRDHFEAKSNAGIEKFMRSNNYLSDPFSDGDPTHAICARGDLSKTDPGAFGCLDTKYTSGSLFKQQISMALSGPTTNQGTLPPFSWSQFPDEYHEGLPMTYDFPFVSMQWKPVSEV